MVVVTIIIGISHAIVNLWGKHCQLVALFAGETVPAPFTTGKRAKGPGQRYQLLLQPVLMPHQYRL